MRYAAAVNMEGESTHHECDSFGLASVVRTKFKRLGPAPVSQQGILHIGQEGIGIPGEVGICLPHMVARTILASAQGPRSLHCCRSSELCQERGKRFGVGAHLSSRIEGVQTFFMGPGYIHGPWFPIGKLLDIPLSQPTHTPLLHTPELGLG